jgi:hypothetical protein
VFSLSLSRSRFRKGNVQSPLKPVGSFPAGAQQCTGNLERLAAEVIDKMLRIYGHSTGDAATLNLQYFDLVHQPY